MTSQELRIGPDDWPQAIADTDGYQIVVAGPGAGKTEFLVRRVAHILDRGLARRDEIVVLCFSRRSAWSLRTRIDKAAGSSGIPLDITTFHSLALRISETLDEDHATTPLTTPEQIALVGDVLAEEDPTEWPTPYRGILGSGAFASEVADFLMRCSERLLTPEDLEVLARERADWRGLPGLYRRYLHRLTETGRTDYGVLLTDTARRLTTEAGEAMSARYRYVLVDEYQDTTPAQARIAGLLAANHQNLTVTGDPYQSIYSFRGAELRNIDDFTTTYPEARRIVLSHSFRVPEEILTAALRVVSAGDLPGAAGPVEPASHPGRVETYVFDQATAEAEWIADQLEHSIVVDGVPPSRIAVLVRSKRELFNQLSRALQRKRVPHDPPDSRLVDHPAVVFVRDLVTVSIDGAGLTTTTPVQAASADRAMRRILLGPVIGLSLGRERELLRERRRTAGPWSQVIRNGLPEHPKLAGLLNDASWAQSGPAAEGFWKMWSDLEGIERVVTDPARVGWRKAWTAFAQTLARQAERDRSVTLARYFALTDDEDFEATPMISILSDDDRVTLTTLHQAKGLEYDIVFIANATEGIFPDPRRSRRMLRPELLSPERTTDAGAQHQFALQEEMRLAYTAMTRARSRVVLTSTRAGSGLDERRPSRFLVAASGVDLEQIGRPEEIERDPISLSEAETRLRRWLLDPNVATPRRLAAAHLLGRHSGSFWDAGRFPGTSLPGPDQPLLGEGFSLSPSQGTNYHACPRRYALERRLGIGNPASPYAAFGSLCHTVLERAEAEIIGTDAIHAELDRVVELINEVWEEADFGTPELDHAWKGKALAMFEHLYSSWPGRGTPVAVEEFVTLEIEGAEWRGVIDRVERDGSGLRVVDLKTAANPVSIPEAAESLQLGFYVLARQSKGEPVVGASFWFPRNASKSVTTRDFDMSRLEEVQQTAVEITRSITAEDWTPRISGSCERCDFKGSCPLWPEGRGAYLP